MRIGPLYEQAVDRSPRAARIAARMLVDESTLPEPLRRSLTVALRGYEDRVRSVDAVLDIDIGEGGFGGRDDDVAAATRFVEACRAVCARG